MSVSALDPKLDAILARRDELQALLSESPPGGYAKLAKEFSDLEPVVATIEAFRAVGSELRELAQLSSDAGTNREMRDLVDAERRALEARLPELERQVRLLLLPKDAADDKNAILEIRAGTGGDEAALFAGDLLRMYQRHADLKGWRCEILSVSDSDLGGVKEVVAEITGQGVFARLKYEAGVHRVQRVPVTEGSGRIHTSAATVAVLPEAEDVDIAIDDKDLRIDVYRASGAGGQHVNRTESAVRITHLPTGLVVAIQDEKSQHKNKAKALKILKARLYDQERAAKDSERAADRKGQVGSGDRSERIRTYNFPQNRLTDHRINLTLYKLDQVIAGEALDEVIEPLINEDEAARLAESGSSSIDAALAGAAAALAAAGLPNPRFEARLLLEAASGWSRAQLLARGAQPLPAAHALPFRDLVERRAAREPMAYVLGRAEFWSLEFVVGPGVLVPRPDSETLIEAALAAFPDTGRQLRVLDIGVGSGCLLLTLLHLFPSAHGVGTDLSEAALACTRLNAERLGVAQRLRLERTSWAEGVADPLDLVVSNPPYIRTAEIAGLQPEVAHFEPWAALDGGPDGLAAYRAILAELPRLLADDGRALLEIGHDQQPAVEALAAAAGFAVTTHLDLAAVPRCLELVRIGPAAD